MRDFDLRELQLCELDILKTFVKLCEKHHLKYYLAWGTLLGAIRHQGFIPWDDDVDVCMPWEDYLKFKEICETELSQEYAYEDWDKHHDYFLCWAKLRKNGTTCMTKNEKSLNIHWGVGIDIFPLFKNDGPTLSFKKKLLRKVLDFIVGRSYVEFGSGLKKVIKKCLLFIVPKSLDDKIIHYCMKELDKASDSFEYLMDIGEIPQRGIWLAGVFGEGNKVVFEDFMANAPSNADDYLKNVYGSDYMVIPKVEDRIDHGNIIVDLEKDYSVYQ